MITLRSLTQAKLLKHCKARGKDPRELLDRLIQAYLKAQDGMDLQRARAKAHRAATDA